jgi:hypothetical protein
LITAPQERRPTIVGRPVIVGVSLSTPAATAFQVHLDPPDDILRRDPVHALPMRRLPPARNHHAGTESGFHLSSRTSHLFARHCRRQVHQQRHRAQHALAVIHQPDELTQVRFPTQVDDALQVEMMVAVRAHLDKLDAPPEMIHHPLIPRPLPPLDRKIALPTRADEPHRLGRGSRRAETLLLLRSLGGREEGRGEVRVIWITAPQERRPTEFDKRRRPYHLLLRQINVPLERRGMFKSSRSFRNCMNPWMK